MKRLFCFFANSPLYYPAGHRNSDEDYMPMFRSHNAGPRSSLVDVKSFSSRAAKVRTIAGQDWSIDDESQMFFKYLELLPLELKFEIVTYLSCEDLCSLRRVSTWWRHFVSDDRIWQEMFLKTYGPLDKLPSMSWKRSFENLASFRWTSDPNARCKYIKLSDSSRTATDQCISKESYKWTTVLAEQSFSAGSVYCEIYIAKCCASNVNTIKIAFGVIDKPPKLLFNCPFGYSSGAAYSGFYRPDDKNSCCFMADGNVMVGSAPYQGWVGKQWKTGDYVGMLVDFTRGSIQYFVNGERQGHPLKVPFMKPDAVKLYPAVSLINGNAVKLMKYPKYGPLVNENQMDT